MRNVLVEAGGGRSEALSRLAGGVERAEDGEVADSRSREHKGWEEFPVRMGGGGIGRTDDRSALARRSEKREGRGAGWKV